MSQRAERVERAESGVYLLCRCLKYNLVYLVARVAARRWKENGAQSYLEKQLMTIMLQDLLRGVALIRAQGALDQPVAGLAYDSRRVVPGGLYVAIQGQHADGHHFLEQAVAQGATALVVDQRHWTGVAPANTTLIVVANSRVALAPLAAAFYDYPAQRLGVVGITGTKGKSTTVDLASQLLEAGGERVGLISTVDFKIGARRWANSSRQSTPEAPEVQALLAEMVAENCALAVVEATSHALSARWNRLGGCAFDVAVFLNVRHEHLDYHGSFEHYRDDKARLFAMLGETPVETISPVPARKRQKWAIANADDPSHELFLAAAPATARRLTFGLHPMADLRASHVQAGPTGATLQVETWWGHTPLRLGLPGSFNVYNALAALGVALSQGVPLEQAAAALSVVRGPRGRMQPVRAGQPFGVIVDYAHSPDSFEQVLGMLRPLVAGRMIAVFGSAGERDIAKRAIQGEIAGRYCELCVLTDEDPRGEDAWTIIDQIAEGVERAGRRRGIGYLCLPERGAAIRAAMAAARPDDLVLLLGKGHEGNIIYADHSQPWDEAAEARQALRELGWNED